MKNFKRNFFFLALIIMILTVVACEHDASKSGLENHAVITLNAPGENSIFAVGDTIKINADAVGELPLHGWQVKIVNKIKNITVFEKSVQIHNNSLQLHVETQWVAQVTEHTDMKLEFSVVLDLKGKLETKTVNFHCYN